MANFYEIYQRLPPAEKNQVAVVVDGKPLTWNDIYVELSRGTELGRKALRIIEQMHFSPITEQQWKIVEERLKKMPEGMRIAFLGVSEPLDKKKALQHIKARDSIGEEIAKIQLEYYKYLLGK